VNDVLSDDWINVSRIAIIGAQGQLGFELCRLLGPAAIPFDLPRFDLLEADQVVRSLTDQKVDAIVNCAAYTQVDQAEQQPERCHAVNVDGVRNLVQAAQKLDCPLVQISTDYVFCGNSGSQPIDEHETAIPLGVYANSKLAGEIAARERDQHLVIRTCGLYGDSPQASNFVLTMLRLAESGNPIRIVDDQHCTPTSTKQLAAAVIHLLRSGASGTYHVTNSGQTTWFHFAKALFDCCEKQPELIPISTAEFQAAAPRPRWSVLSTAKYLSHGGPVMTSWQQALEDFLITIGAASTRER